MDTPCIALPNEPAHWWTARAEPRSAILAPRLLTKGGAKLSDFGLAERFELIAPHPADLLASPRVAFGTPRYMSPEQVLGTQVGPRSDVFSLGVVIYEMVTGRRPFDAASVSETIDAVLHKQPEAVSVLNPDTPPQMAQLVTKCLEKDLERAVFRQYQARRDEQTRIAQMTPMGSPTVLLFGDAPSSTGH